MYFLRKLPHRGLKLLFDLAKKFRNQLTKKVIAVKLHFDFHVVCTEKLLKLLNAMASASISLS